MTHSAFRRWLPLALVTTAFCGLSFACAQQILRQGAYDIPLHVADLAEQALRDGRPPASIVAPMTVDITHDSNVFLIILDGAKKEIASSLELNGRHPTPPPGVLDQARKSGEDRVTWQPQPGARAAIVARYVSAKDGWYVVAGQSLKETESRNGKILWMVLAAWVATLAVSFALVFALKE